jgi:hypothetical protein
MIPEVTMDRRALRSLAAAVIFEGFRAALRPGPFTPKIGLAQQWLFDPRSNLDDFAAVLGHSGDHYRRLARRIRDRPLRKSMAWRRLAAVIAGPSR